MLVLQLSEMRGFGGALGAARGRDAAKLGVGISNDGLLRRDYGVRCAGLVDLSPLAGRALADGARPWNLADLCERVLGRRLPKELRLSDREASRSRPSSRLRRRRRRRRGRIHKELERRWERRPTGRAAPAGAATFAGACAELSVDAAWRRARVSARSKILSYTRGAFLTSTRASSQLHKSAASVPCQSRRRLVRGSIRRRVRTGRSRRSIRCPNASGTARESMYIPRIVWPTRYVKRGCGLSPRPRRACAGEQSVQRLGTGRS